MDSFEQQGNPWGPAQRSKDRPDAPRELKKGKIMGSLTAIPGPPFHDKWRARLGPEDLGTSNTYYFESIRTTGPGSEI